MLTATLAAPSLPWTPGGLPQPYNGNTWMIRRDRIYFVVHNTVRVQYRAMGSNLDTTITRTKAIVNGASAVSLFSHLHGPSRVFLTHTALT